MSRDEPRSESSPAGDPNPHVPVLLREVVEQLGLQSGGRYVDATLGAGGYAGAILDGAEESELLGLDRDPRACRHAAHRLRQHGRRLRVEHAPFDAIDEVLDSIGWERVQGIVADLGLSSLQLDDPARGFSFQQDGPLDMRFDPEAETSAAQLVNELEEGALADLIYRFGDERRSRAVARRIVRARPIETTTRLREIVRSAFPRPATRRRGGRRTDSATRTFQALRIAVNDELSRLERLVEKAPWRLAIGGRLVIVSYHSLEDRIVKWAFRELASPADTEPCFRLLTKKPLTPGEDELAHNPRSRSAKLRALERIA